MNSYEITVLYSCHGTSEEAVPAFPEQTVPAEQIQLITLQEDDVYHPHKKAFEAISRAEGKYTILLDAGDKYDRDFLEKMHHAAKDPEAAFSMPYFINHFVHRLNDYFTLHDVGDITVDTGRGQEVLPLELHGLMIRTDRLKEALNHVVYPVEAEKQVVLSLMEQNPCFRYMGTCSLDYSVPKECDSPYDVNCLTREWYYDSLEQFLLPLLKEDQKTHQQVNPIYQCMTVYMIHTRMRANINNKNKHVIPREDVPAYMELYSTLLEYVTPDILLNQKSRLTCATPQVRLLDYRLKLRDFSYYPDLVCGKNNVQVMCAGHEIRCLKELAVHLFLLDYKKGKLEIDGGYTDYYAPGSCEIQAKFDGRNYPVTLNERYSMTKYFGVTAFRMKTFHVSIPVEDTDRERKLQFVLCSQGKEYTLQYEFPVSTSHFAKDFGYMYWKFGKYLSYWKGNAIHVVRSSKLLVLRKELCLWLQMWKKKGGAYRNELPLKILNFLLRPYFSRQKIWLFLDKIYKGADSSEYMYRYAVKQKDGIKKYYLLDKNSADYTRMRKEGYRPLVRDSLKHQLVFLNASMVIASNSTVFPFNNFGFVRSLPIRGDVNFDVACVQHGMSIQKIAIAQQRLKDNTALYFCASKYEIENLSKPIYDYVGYDALKLTGVPRYDGLKSRPQKIIVISPTWRMNSALPVTVSEGISRDYNPNFRETNYYRVYNGLINDPRLLEAVSRYGYRIQYVLHPIVSPQHEDFVKNDYVEIIPSIGDMSYEKIFCEGALMVTDFSGVQFDFAYMRKPVVYLHHHDIPQHYEEGTFHYDTMGFGEICHTNEELIDVLCEYMKNDCVMPEIYRKRADDFFAFSDNNNCERIYPIMLEHERNRDR